MKRTRHTPEQIVRKLREADWLLAEKTPMAEVMASWRSLTGPTSVGALNTKPCFIIEPEYATRYLNSHSGHQYNYVGKSLVQGCLSAQVKSSKNTTIAYRH